MGFCYMWQLLDTGLGALKTASKKIVQKATEATGEFLKNKIADKIVKPKHIIEEKTRDVEKINIPQGKRKEILNELRKVL